MHSVNNVVDRNHCGGRQGADAQCEGEEEGHEDVLVTLAHPASCVVLLSQYQTRTERTKLVNVLLHGPLRRRAWNYPKGRITRRK